MNYPNRHIFILLFVIVLLGNSCQNPPAEPLPILGEKEVIDGETKYHEISDFKFTNQDGQIITNETFNNKIYLVDFFFISCQTICPKVAQQMLRIHDEFESEDRVKLIAHTIDPKRDTIDRLKWYADKLGVKSDKWHFVTGDKEKLYDMADEYFIVAKEDADAPDGFDHSPTIILVDENRRVRSFCNGTDPEEVDRLIKDVETLLNES
ncbi:MAG: SCO family protein [Saprospiraceae bacterium]